MDFDALVEAQTGLGTAAVIVMNKQVFPLVNFRFQKGTSYRPYCMHKWLPIKKYFVCI